MVRGDLADGMGRYHRVLFCVRTAVPPFSARRVGFSGPPRRGFPNCHLLTYPEIEDPPRAYLLFDGLSFLFGSPAPLPFGSRTTLVDPFAAS